MSYGLYGSHPVFKNFVVVRTSIAWLIKWVKVFNNRLDLLEIIAKVNEHVTENTQKEKKGRIKYRTNNIQWVKRFKNYAFFLN